jgi:hypothetical protein
MSTNEKMNRLINDRPASTDADVSRERNAEKAAKDRLRRGALYGAGARALIPKVKKKPSTTSSPFVLLKEVPSMNKNLEVNSIPPTAHEDMFRIVQYPTEKSRNDPDRIFYTTKSCTEGVRHIHQPPWFFGYQNKTLPADSSMLLAANRYGFRGSKDIKQFHTKNIKPPEQTRTDHTPKFLQGNSVIDEWVPPLRGEVVKDMFQLTTPIMWPENAEYPTGFKPKRRPTSPVYNRETTIGILQPLPVPPSLMGVYEGMDTEKQLLSTNSKLESQGKILSPPMHDQQEFLNTWRSRLDDFANPSLKMTMSKKAAPTEQHKLMDGDFLRYSGSTAVLCHSCSTDELKYRLRMEHHEENPNLAFRWKQVIPLLLGMKVRLRREQTLRTISKDLARKLLYQSIKFGQKYYIDRAQFITAICETPSFEHVPIKQKNVLFSAFDDLKRNLIRFVTVIRAFAVVDNINESPAAKLSYMWMLEEEFGDPQPPLERIFDILCSVVGSEGEKKLMLEAFDKEFKPACYRYSISAIHPSDSIQQTKYAPGKTANMKSFAPAYTICDNVIDAAAFVKIQEDCPQTMSLFSMLLNARIATFTGSS